MTRRWSSPRGASALALVVLLLAGCTDPAPSVDLAAGSTGQPAPTPSEGQPVLAYGTPEQDVLEVFFSGCENDADVQVSEDQETVRVLVDGPNGECEPYFGQRVELERPLAGRQVVDAASGASVPPETEPTEDHADVLEDVRRQYEEQSSSDSYDL